MSRSPLIPVLAVLCLSLLAPTGTLAQTTPSPIPSATSTQVSTPAATDTPLPTGTPAAVPAAATAAPTSTDAAAPAPTATPYVSAVPCARDDPSNERVRRSERHGNDDDDYRGNDDQFGSGNGRNEVIVHNCTDSRLRVRASIQLNTIPGHVVQPLNEAYAEGSCNGCQTFAVALQIDLYSSDRATDIEPQNYAVALNTGCSGCVTVARALQFVQPSDDPRDVSRDVSDDIERLDSELTAIQSDPTISLQEAETRLNAVLVSFNQLGGTLGDQRDERDD